MSQTHPFHTLFRIPQMTLEELQDYLRKKLRTAYNLGQTYWQQADSEYRSQQKKSSETADKFGELIEHVVAAVTFEMNRAAAQESAPADPVPVYKFHDNGEVTLTNADKMPSYVGQPQPVAEQGELPPLSIKTWQERLREKFPETADRNLFAVGHLEHAMESEIADLRAALSRPVVAKTEGTELRWCYVPTKEMFGRPTATDAMEYAESRLHDPAEIECCKSDVRVPVMHNLRKLLAAAPASPQPPVQRASELTDERGRETLLRMARAMPCQVTEAK